MKLYGGIDLHSNNSYVVLLNEEDKIIYQKRLVNDLAIILSELAVHREDIIGLVVESTYNWYWLVDGLQEAGHTVHLANTCAIAQYSGLKYTDDKTDAIWLARLLRLNLLQEGYIYPKEERGIRELLRRRLQLVKQQTMFLLSIQSMVSRYENVRLSSYKIKHCTIEEIVCYLKETHVECAVQSQLTVLKCLMNEIKVLEEAILKEIKENKFFKLLQEIPGIGPILAMTILLETGDISRFRDAGNYSSYCRCVESKRISNAKKKGENNRKNGNVYLGWAYVEAANFSIRSSEIIKRYYQRKLSKTKRVIALKTIANKLAKACYFILRDEVSFEVNRLFV